MSNTQSRGQSPRSPAPTRQPLWLAAERLAIDAKLVSGCGFRDYYGLLFNVRGTARQDGAAQARTQRGHCGRARES